MSEQQHSLEELIFGTDAGPAPRPESELAELISAWYRQARANQPRGDTTRPAQRRQGKDQTESSGLPQRQRPAGPASA